MGGGFEYYALIKTDTKENALEIYEEHICDDHMLTLDDIVEVSYEYAKKKCGEGWGDWCETTSHNTICMDGDLF